MGKVKLIIGIIFSSKEIKTSAETELTDLFGPIDLRSEIIPFDFTDYYSEEMGSPLSRCWLSFEKLVNLENIYQVKIKTNNIEKKYSVEGKRKINLDPGYVAGSKLILFSTKNYSHRIHLAENIFAEVTLIYKNDKFNVLQWTYPDYKTELANKFFCSVRLHLNL